MEDSSLTGVFGPEGAAAIRGWEKFRRQFTATSLSVIGAIATIGAGYIAYIHQALATVSTRVVVLETQVIPVIKDEGLVAGLNATVTGHEGRITRLEHDYDIAYRESDSPPVPRRRTK
jgi:hypothetical protein